MFKFIQYMCETHPVNYKLMRFINKNECQKMNVTNILIYLPINFILSYFALVSTELLKQKINDIAKLL